MSLWRRIANVFRGDRLSRDLEEELQSHIAEAISEGRDPGESRRAFGSLLSHREKSRDIRLVPWMESLYADAVFARRQLLKRKTASAAAILSLALAIGSCVAAFRLMDALLWRPLPVAAPERLYVLTVAGISPARTGNPVLTSDVVRLPDVPANARRGEGSGRFDRDLGRGPRGSDLRVGSGYREGIPAVRFGVDVPLVRHPARGGARADAENDDLTLGAHPYAVLSYDYWKRRFAEDPKVVGRTFRTGNEVYQIVGVAEGPFTGTEPGTVTDIFLPTMMMKNNAIVRSDYQWILTLVHLKPGVSPSLVHEKLRPAFRAFLEERAKSSAGLPKRERDGFTNQRLLVTPAPAGVSETQKYYATALSVLGVLVILVLFISCANVANLMTAQAAARQREMALRVSIGAGRWRLVQLVVVECAWLAFAAACLGALFAWWAAPWIVEMIGTPDNPARLILPADWRVLGFGVAMALACTVLFSLAPAHRASGVKPASALKGGDPHTRPRMVRLLIAAQVAFCVLVLFVAGLFMATSGRLSDQRTGFSAERLLTLETVTPQPQPEPLWEQVAERLRTAPGVEAVALCEWPLMAGGSWNGFISVQSAPPGPVASYFLSVSPEWREVMKIPLLQGRDFRASDALPGAALVNETFGRQFFRTENPAGRSFDVVSLEGRHTPYQIVGVVGDARYKDMREPMQPTAYFPFKARYARGTFIVRTASRNPMAMASALRLDVPRARAGFRVSNILTQTALIEQHTVRERLLATLALFFGAVALSLAGVGLYGVLDYSVLQRRREIGIRIAIGAQAGDIAWSVIAEIFAVVAAGAFLGIVLGIASVRFIETLLYEVKATDLRVLALPTATIFAVALVAALPAVIRALRIDPVTMLRSE